VLINSTACIAELCIAIVGMSVHLSVLCQTTQAKITKYSPTIAPGLWT